MPDVTEQEVEDKIAGKPGTTSLIDSARQLVKQKEVQRTALREIVTLTRRHRPPEGHPVGEECDLCVVLRVAEMALDA